MRSYSRALVLVGIALSVPVHLKRASISTPEGIWTAVLIAMRKQYGFSKAKRAKTVPHRARFAGRFEVRFNDQF